MQCSAYDRRNAFSRVRWFIFGTRRRSVTFVAAHDKRRTQARKRQQVRDAGGQSDNERFTEHCPMT